jgi:L-threonylcarbamoyladenylate synthase
MVASRAESNLIYLPSGPVDLARAARTLLEGELVAFPTETVYGLGADAENPTAVEKIYRAKGRPANHPVIVHLAPEADLSYWVAALPWQAERLIAAFWPGPLTLILKRSAHINSTVSGGQDSIGLRCPSHPVAVKLLQAFASGKPSGKGGVAAPSANRFGHVSPTLAAHVREEFAELVAAGMPVLEGGASEVGIESTIIDLSRTDLGIGPMILRPGFISAGAIETILGDRVWLPDAQAPRVSGALKSHYAPATPLHLASLALLKKMACGAETATNSSEGLGSAERIAIVSYTTPRPPDDALTQIDWITISSDPVQYAHELYARLRELDKLGYASLWFEHVPQTTLWAGVKDRLSRAAAATFDTLDNHDKDGDTTT